MKFRIDQNIIEKFPDIKLGVLIVNNIDNTIEPNLEFKSLKMQRIEKTIKKIENIELSSITAIKDFRKAYSSCGIKHKKYPSSVESLLKRVKKTQDLPNINLIVDIYNIVSISHQLPIGADDLDYIDSYISLELLKEELKFQKLGTQEIKTIQAFEPCYRDSSEVLCEKWNYRECEKSKITKKSSNICFVIEGLEHTTLDEIKLAISDLKALLQQFCGGEYKEYFLDKHNTSFLI